MRDYAFVAYLALLLLLGMRRPFLFVLGYVYIDLVSPQRLSYYLLSSVPVSLIFFAAAFVGWVFTDARHGFRITVRQLLILALLGWAGWTTAHADFPIDAAEKWDWVWKTLVFAVFLPMTLRTRLRIEAMVVFMILSVASIVITGGIKTLASGGGYGMLNLGVSNNSGLYEGSTISMVAVGMIPLILFAMQHGTIFRPDWRVRLFGYALIFACLLIPIGTQARTGLICIGLLAVMLLRMVKRRLLYLGILAAAVAVAVPLLPDSYSKRMETIEGYQGDESASTRIAVWGWTLDYVRDHPMGGGFGAYRQNRFVYHTRTREGDAAATVVDGGRAWHSSYFEMLGEQGYGGLALWLTLNLIGLVRTEVLRRRYLRAGGDADWIAPLASALQMAHILYLVGSMFLALAFASFAYMWMGLQIALDLYCARREREAGFARWGRPARVRGASPAAG